MGKRRNPIAILIIRSSSAACIEGGQCGRDGRIDCRNRYAQAKRWIWSVARGTCEQYYVNKLTLLAGPPVMRGPMRMSRQLTAYDHSRCNLSS
ncbi:hypothetical protein PYCCODRAFT_908684 [Trametes coccinea BRFM310]|uniref:Secreted protein n=1 Tax=Trametes coccinea (strain BRFM310) TaxID=1353009 RepID=A0A1Y2IG47_TRAC3|nr:hypothetical protein PYCCODRAFT_908684 [Trametes coccinea BRFM310]